MRTLDIPSGTDRIDNAQVYWLRVTAFIPGLGASVAFDQGRPFLVRGLHAWQSPQIPGEQLMQPTMRPDLGKAQPFASETLGVSVPLVYWTRKPWKRVDLAGPVAVEFSEDPFEPFPGPLMTGLLEHPGTEDALIRHAAFFVAGRIAAVAAQFPGLEFNTSGMAPDGSTALRLVFLALAVTNANGTFDGNIGPSTGGGTARNGLRANNFPTDTAVTEQSLGHADEMSVAALPAFVTATPRRLHFGPVAANNLYTIIGSGVPPLQTSAQYGPAPIDRRVIGVYYSIANTQLDYWAAWTEHTVNDPIS